MGRFWQNRDSRRQRKAAESADTQCGKGGAECPRRCRKGTRMTQPVPDKAKQATAATPESWRQPASLSRSCRIFFRHPPFDRDHCVRACAEAEAAGTHGQSSPVAARAAALAGEGSRNASGTAHPAGGRTKTLPARTGRNRRRIMNSVKDALTGGNLYPMQ